MSDEVDPKWPHGKYVCTQCKEKRTARYFALGSKKPTICTLCREEGRKETLAKQIADRKARRHIVGRNRREGQLLAAKRGGQATARVLKAEKAERQKELQAVRKRVAKEAAVEAREVHTPAAMAELELASRELARRSLLHYVERNVPGYVAGWVHEDICRRLEQFMADVEAKRSPRVMLWLPPRHGKSEIASTQFPSWVLGHHPDWEFISTSYTVDLPLGFSRKIRAKIASDDYKVLFSQTDLARDSTSAENWRTTKGGGFRAAGVGGGITGMGAHILVIDDPVKDQEEADSEAMRAKVWEWFGSTAYTRLAPGGGVLIIQTRWHDDDLSGRVERQMKEGLKEAADIELAAKVALADAASREEKKETIADLRRAKELRESVDLWEVVKYPAVATQDEFLDAQLGRIVTPESHSEKSLAENRRYRKLRSKGDALHPARFPLPLLRKYKRTLTKRAWSALYQQSPTPDEGMFFTKDAMRYRTALPDHREMYTFVAWDLAVGQKTSNDWSVGAVGALDWEDNLWIIDLIRGRWNTHQLAEIILDTHIRYNAQLTGIEKGQLELAIMPQLQKRMRERNSYIALAEGSESLRPITDKIVRARPLQGRMQQGKVLFPMDQPWVDTILAELLRFPTGTNDDIVDALAWLVRMILGKSPPQKPTDILHKRGGFKSWRDRLNGIMPGGSKVYMGR